MFEDDIAKKIAEARAQGCTYVLACVDTWDRARGDKDLGYYYPMFSQAADVAEYLRRVGHGAPGGDFCKSVIHLNADGAAVRYEPHDWLTGRALENRPAVHG